MYFVALDIARASLRFDHFWSFSVSSLLLSHHSSRVGPEILRILPGGRS